MNIIQNTIKSSNTLFKTVIYNNKDKEKWDNFVENSAKNGHFIFKRDFMEYHKDRFKDLSLLIYYKDTLIGVLPAHQSDNSICSHYGLSFGGLILSKKISTPLSIQAFYCIIAFLKSCNLEKWVYKPIPYIYEQMPSQEDLYCLHVLKSRIVKRDICSVIDIKTHYRWSSGTKRNLNKGLIAGLGVKKSDDIEIFFSILVNVLDRKYSTTPVHSLEELKQLQQAFPNNIELYMCYQDNTPLGGILLFVTPVTIHTQYIAISDLGKTLGGLEIILKYLLDYYKDKRFLSLGTSHWPTSGLLNEQLLDNKERFGARSILIETHEIDLNSVK